MPGPLPPLATGLVTLAAGTGAVVAAGRGFLAHQARTARTAIGKPLGEQAIPADRTYRKSSGDPLDLLLLGDSIAAGLGAESARKTLGGQLARRLARHSGRAVRLHTAAVVGAESSDLALQLDGLPADYRPDVTVVVVGGNDVTHRVRVSLSRAHLADAVLRLQELGSAVVVGTCPDLGTLRAVPQPLRTLVGVLSRQLAAAQHAVAVETGATAVNLAEVVGPFFVTRPDEMFSVDRFHPSDAGYRRTAKALLPSVVAALEMRCVRA